MNYMRDEVDSWKNRTQNLDTSVANFHYNMKSSVTSHMWIFQTAGSLPLILDEPSFSEVAKLFFAFPFMLSGICIVNLMLLFPPDISTAGPATRNAFIISNVAFCALPIVHTMNMFNSRNKFEDTLNSLIYLQHQLRISRSSYFHDYAMFFITLGLLLIAAFTIHDYRDGKYTISTFIDDLFWTYYYLYLVSICLQLSFLQHSIGKCFQKLRSSKIYWGSGQQRLLVNAAIKHHHVVSEICRDITELYHWSISLILLGMFCAVLAMTASVISAPAVDVYWGCQFVIWSSHHVLLTWHIQGSCQHVTERAEECNKALLSYIIHDKSEVYQDNFRAFLPCYGIIGVNEVDKNLQYYFCTYEWIYLPDFLNPLVMIHLSSRKALQFTACKCVNVDYRLGLSMIAAFLTYIVVLFQIENPHSASSSTTIAPTLSTLNTTSA